MSAGQNIQTFNDATLSHPSMHARGTSEWHVAFSASQPSATAHTYTRTSPESTSRVTETPLGTREYTPGYPEYLDYP